MVISWREKERKGDFETMLLLGRATCDETSVRRVCRNVRKISCATHKVCLPPQPDIIHSEKGRNGGDGSILEANGFPREDNECDAVHEGFRKQRVVSHSGPPLYSMQSIGC